MATLTPTQLLTELQALLKTPPTDLSPSLRTQLGVAAQAVAREMEKPEDVVARILLSQPVEAVTIRIAIDLQLFSLLGDGEKTLEELVKGTKAEPELLVRILRSLTASAALQQTPQKTYKLHPSYTLFTNPHFATSLAHCADFLTSSYNALPAFLKSTAYHSPHDPTNTAVQAAFGAKGKDLIGILTEKPDAGMGFGTLMSTWGEGNSLVQDLYPVGELGVGFESEGEGVMWVDVGGGYGQKSVALKKAFPELPGRFIVQDLGEPVGNAPVCEGIEFMEHDFFGEQGVRGARAYYIRQCLHNWPAEKCLTILTELRKAMKPGYSKLFVHELIVPAVGASKWVVTQDFNMMTLCATMERTEEQWREMLEKAGLKVIKVCEAADGVSEGVIVAEVL